MKSLKKIVFIIFITSMVATVFATILYYLVEKLHTDSFFNYSLNYVKEIVFEEGGIKEYISLFFQQSPTLLIAYLSISAAIMAFSLSLFSKQRIDALILATAVIYTIFQEYMVTVFVDNITSGLLFSLCLILFYCLVKRKIFGKILLSAIIVPLLFCIDYNKETIIFIVASLIYVLLAKYVLPLYKERLIINILLAATILAYIYTDFHKDFKPNVKHAIQMETAARNDDWERVLALAKKNVTNTRLTCYLTNLALIKTGHFNSQLFTFPQVVGVNGLEIQTEYTALNDVIFDIVGAAPQALRCAFENYVVYGKSYYNIKRLIYYFDKCDNQLIHNKFAAMLPSYNAPKDKGYITKGIDSLLIHDLKAPLLSTLETIVSNDKNNKPAFEVLMAYYALSGRVVRFAENIPVALDFFPEGLPQYYQELLLIYEDFMLNANKPIEKLPISPKIREQYNNFKRNSDSKRLFGRTYWYYAKEINPSKVKFYLN